MADSPNDEGLGHARYGTLTGTVSLVHDVLDLVDLCGKKISEFYGFDQTTMALLIRFAREIARLEVWCQSMGYERNMDGTFRRPTDAALPPELKARKRSIIVINMSLAELSKLLKDIVRAFGTMADARLGKMDDFLDYLQSAPQPTTNPSASYDLESAAGFNSETVEQVYSRLRECGIVTQNTDATGKVTEIAKKTHSFLRMQLSELSDQNGILESFVMAQKLDAFSHLVPHRLLEVRSDIRTVQAGIGAIKTGIDGIQAGIGNAQQQLTFDRLTSMFEAARGLDFPTQVASLNSLLVLRNVNLIDLPGQALDITISGHEIRDVRDYAPEQGRRIASCRGALRLVEWNQHIKTETDGDRNQVRRRLGNLVAGLGFEEPDGLRLLRTLGYVEDVQGGKYRYGIVYQLQPNFGHGIPEVVTLKELFLSVRATLGQRFRLATTLARAFRCFQTSQWLHQGISSDNIIFIHETGASPSFERPYIVGFDFARHVTSDSDKRIDNALEADFYQHRLRRKRGQDDKAVNPYRGEFDIYSIGRVLLDIAEWTVIEDAELDTAVSELPEVVGEFYTHAVRWCLGLSDNSPVHEDKIKATTPSPQGTGAWSGQLIREFEGNVLMKIGECRA